MGVNEDVLSLCCEPKQSITEVRVHNKGGVMESPHCE